MILINKCIKIVDYFVNQNILNSKNNPLIFILIDAITIILNGLLKAQTLGVTCNPLNTIRVAAKSKHLGALVIKNFKSRLSKNLHN